MSAFERRGVALAGVLLLTCQGHFPTTDGDGDVDSDVDSDGDSDGDSDEDHDPPEAMRVVAELAGLWRRMAEEYCSCYDLWGSFYESEEDCLTARNRTRLVTCFGEILPAYGDEMVAYWDCYSGAEELHAECVENGACTASSWQACDAAFDDDRSVCSPPAEAEAFDDELGACLVGDPSGCPDDSSAPSRIGPAVFVGDTTGTGNDLAGSCGGDGSAELAYLWAAPSTADFIIDTVGSEVDTLLYVLDGSCGGLELACNDDIDLESGDLDSRVTVSLTAGQVVVIVVDSWHRQVFGAFQVNISAAG